ncbi:16S rRNA G1207 methylase RsmC [Agromyces flavus]|uniref:16S rRNA G1207 methylase RsmC n=1 Tax=Agromyces flavus TaxID=589382 RepID=A0A1H1SZB2_9MICO|nr:methyltransferase [Agromyces flavus]MCP2369264.1 16S rRNA G1207 methylase RsmC [Agromyces flavus]GGI48762.1 16S RNA G1207 methylase RsmC [Agromyces flavus]SDS53335.1 Methyltransferase small domain-containing protein [Agromyces flavus]
MPQEHYFSSKPADDDALRTVTVRLAGRELDVLTAGGVFSPAHVDLGTRVLLDAVPQPPATGHLLDLGAGWGPIALTLGLDAPEATVWAVDVNERALDLVRRNAARLGLRQVNAALPDDVPDDVRFATIWSNPPIRIGKAELHALLRRWLPRLEVGATAWLVVQKNLGADSLQRWLADELGNGWRVERASSAKGFRLLAVTRER